MCAVSPPPNPPALHPTPFCPNLQPSLPPCPPHCLAPRHLPTTSRGRREKKTERLCYREGLAEPRLMP